MRSPSLAVLCVAVLAGGCSAPRLVDERRQEPYAGLLARYEGAARSERRERVTPAGDEPVVVALEALDGDRADARPVLVLQPGMLADRHTWRFLAGALADEFDLVLLDPPGTGASDKPPAGARGSGRYSPTWLADCTLEALAAWDRDHGGARRYVLVGHSLGGAVVLRALADPALVARHGGLLGRVSGAVLIAPADLTMTRRSEIAMSVVCLTDCLAGLGGNLGVLRKEVRQGVRDSVSHPERDALAGDALRMEALLGRAETRHAVRTMLLRFQPLRADMQPDLEAAARLAEPERGITQPILLLWGARDAALPAYDSERLRERLATERYVLLEGLGHSPHQEGVLRVADEVRGFLRDRIAPAPAR